MCILGSADVLAALQELECDELSEPVKQAVQAWRELQNNKRTNAKQAKQQKATDTAAEDNNAEHAEDSGDEQAVTEPADERADNYESHAPSKMPRIDLETIQ